MNAVRTFVFLLIFTGLLSPVMAQDDDDNDGPTSGTLSEQFENMKSISTTYRSPNNNQNYKVVKVSRLDEFFRNVRDSLQKNDGIMAEKTETIEKQETRISTLETQLGEQEKAVTDSEYDTRHIEVLGMDIEKGSYKTMNWVIILALIIILAFFLYKYKESNKVAVQKKSEYDTLEENFNVFKQNARDKEIKLKRELQTELNRNEELNQKLSTRK